MAENYWQDPIPGFKWPIQRVQPLQVPADEVWQIISLPGNLEFCHPFCAANPVQNWPGEGSRDEVHYLSGWVYVRRFCRWIDGVGYDLEIGREGGGQSFVSWRIKPLGEHNSQLAITVYPHALQNLPAAVRWLPHIIYLAPHLKSYLSSVSKGFEWFITQGDPVPKDHFGPHPWFSAKK